MRWPMAILVLLPTLAYAVPSKHILIAKVVRVIDGDTIVVLTDDQTEERIRLWGIDAPDFGNVYVFDVWAPTVILPQGS